MKSHGPGDAPVQVQDKADHFLLWKRIVLCSLLATVPLDQARAASAGVAGKYFGVASWSVSCSETDSASPIVGPFSMRLKTSKTGLVTGSAMLSGTSSDATWVAELTFTNLTLLSTNQVTGACAFKVYVDSTLVQQGTGSLDGELHAPAAMVSGIGSNAQGCVVQWTMSAGGEFFPLDLSNTWRSIQTTQDGGQLQQAYDTESVVGTTQYNGQAAVVLTDSIFTDPPSPSEVYRALDTQGLWYLGNNDPADPLTPIVAPFRSALLPARPRLKWTTYRRRGAVYGDDLDGDGLPETASVQGKAIYGAFESVPTQLGQFENCLRLDTLIKLTVKLSAIRRSVKLTALDSQWYAYGIGPVKSVTTLMTATKPPLISTMTQELTGYRINGVGRGIVGDMIVATNLTTADSDTEGPGEPAVASDGTNFLVVTSQDLEPPSGLIGIVVTGDGQVLQRVPITSQLSQFSHPQLVFEGDNYLLTWNQDSQTYGAEISTNGTVLVAPFQISDGTGTQFGARAAFDGQRALVVWAKYTSEYDIVGAFVAPDGTVSNEFPICAATGEQVSPYVVFTGTNYFVAWRDTRSGSGPASDTDIYGTVVTPAGTVLDTNGVPVVATADVEEPTGLAVDGQGRPVLVWNAAGSIWARRLTPEGASLDGLATAPGLLVATNAGSACVTFDGANYLVAYSVGAYTPPKGIYVSRMTPDGTLINTPTGDAGVLVRAPVELTERFLQPACARGNGNLLLVWLNNRETSGELKSVEGALLYPF